MPENRANTEGFVRADWKVSTGLSRELSDMLGPDAFVVFRQAVGLHVSRATGQIVSLLVTTNSFSFFCVNEGLTNCNLTCYKHVLWN